ncbi:MAG: hypothetical protein J6Y20_05585 [Lachnospiraceae bacterium]|nr:hypothetical protein [Lachnospiraceae bacterium]
MSIPITINLDCYKGQTFIQNLYFKHNGEAIDLTGKTARAQIRHYKNDPDLAAEFRVVIYPEYGKVALNLSADETAALMPGIYCYDMKMTDENDIVKYWIEGTFHVKGRVTE